MPSTSSKASSCPTWPESSTVFPPARSCSLRPVSFTGSRSARTALATSICIRPGPRYAKLARARRDGVEFDPADGDSFPPPADGGLSAAEALLHHADEGEQGENVVKTARPELSLLVLEFGPGSGVDPHFHKGHSDSFFVLEGELEIHAGDEVVTAVPGTYVLAPPHVVHWFRNVSDAPVRFVNMHTPGGFAQYRLELQELRAQGVEPDRAFFERHDIFDV
jgi:quercetin dioxygenase-like cupin family protein